MKHTIGFTIISNSAEYLGMLRYMPQANV